MKERRNKTKRQSISFTDGDPGHRKHGALDRSWLTVSSYITLWREGTHVSLTELSYSLLSLLNLISLF
jgi:hypothetical protein